MKQQCDMEGAYYPRLFGVTSTTYQPIQEKYSSKNPWPPGGTFAVEKRDCTGKGPTVMLSRYVY